ncbi:MAG: flagellar hook-length control protein FliK [Wujia sp.]|nr:flagellar hook-length control protein FliK [Wujia sp.]MDY3727382.1 flagellar hook-length control protein FliK [Wujia sp.]
MIVSIQSGGIGKVDMSQTGNAADKLKSKDKASGMFADLMNLASANPDTITKAADDTLTKKDANVVKRADTNVSDGKKQTDLNKYTKTDVKSETTHVSGEKTNQSETPQETDEIDLKAQLLSAKLKKLLNVDDETLENLLQTTGVLIQDLLDPTAMQDFILQVNDATSVDLLIDESLNNLVQQALQLLNDVLTESTGTGNTEVYPDEMVFQGDTASAQTEEQPAAGTEKMQMVETEAEPAAHITPENKTVQTDAKGSGIETDNAEVQITVQTENAGDTDASADWMKQNADDVISNLNQAMTQAATGPALTETYDTVVSQTDIVRQVVDEIKLNLSKDVTSMTLQLNPEQLGKVQIHVTTKNGVMQAQIIAETEAARNAVESGLSLLKEAFDNRDLKVDAIEVMVGTQDYFENGEAQTQADAESGRENQRKRVTGINLQADSDDEISENQKLESEMMKAQGNQVSYMV